jgi:hypothetical protein
MPLVRSAPKLWLEIVTAFMCGLAAGALWCLLALATDHDPTFLIVPLAIVLAFFLRWQGYQGRRGAICAVAATLIAFIYAQYLFAAVRIAQMLGFSLRGTLFKMDFALAWQAARANLSAWDLGLLLLACVVATGIMLRQVSSRAMG